MRHSYFQFRNAIYVVEKGTNMGNPLSPLISELFMAHFEMRLKDSDMLPRVWRIRGRCVCGCEKE